MSSAQETYSSLGDTQASASRVPTFYSTEQHLVRNTMPHHMPTRAKIDKQEFRGTSSLPSQKTSSLTPSMPVSESFAKGFALPMPSNLSDSIPWDFKNRSFSERFPHKLPKNADETVWRRRPHQGLARSFKPHSYAGPALGPYRSNYYSSSQALSRQDLSDQPRIPSPAAAAVQHPSRFHRETLPLADQQDLELRAHAQALVGVPTELRGRVGRNTTSRLPNPLDYSYTTKIDVGTGAVASPATGPGSSEIFSKSASCSIFGSALPNAASAATPIPAPAEVPGSTPGNPFRRPCPDPLYRRTSDSYGAFELDDPASKHFVYFPRQHHFSTALSAGR